MKPATRAPFFACMYHGLAEVARKHGYALTIHGTVTTDLDLVAIPWVDEAVDAVTLKDALMNHVGACGFADHLRKDLPEEQVAPIVARMGEAADTKKPHGRRAWNLYMDFGCKVDLSVMPRAGQWVEQAAANIDAEFVVEHRAGGRHATVKEIADFLRITA